MTSKKKTQVGFFLQGLTVLILTVGIYNLKNKESISNIKKKKIIRLLHLWLLVSSTLNNKNLKPSISITLPAGSTLD